MKIEDLANLIAIRNYVATSINNHSIKRDVVNQLNTNLMLLDKLLTECLVSQEFKNIIKFERAEEVVQEVVQNNNIKHNMNPSSKIVTVSDGKPEIK